MIRIAFVIDTIEKPTAGTEKQLLLLLEHLDRTKFDPVLCILRPSKWIDEKFNLCPVYILGLESFKQFRIFLSIWRFVRFLKSNNISVVYSFFKEGVRIGAVAGKIAKVKLNIVARRSQGYWMSAIDFRITRFIYRYVDLVVVNSYNTKRWLSITEKIPSDKIKVVYNGLELEKFNNVPIEVSERYRECMGIPLDKPVIGIVANLRPVKAHDVFLRAAQLVTKEVPETYFLIVGHGELLSPLKQLSRKLCIAEQVYFLGSRQDIPAILAMIDIGVLSSNSESFSNAVIEYIAAGLTVVCTDVGGAREVVEDGMNGYVVPPGDYVLMAERLITLIHAKKSTEMRHANLQKAKDRFSLAKMVDQHEKIFQN